MKNRKEIIILLIFLVLTSVFLYFTKKTSLENQSYQQGIVLAESTEKNLEWATYHNDTFGFEVKYPGDWATPEEETINDPDYNYIYRASFGTDQGFAGETAEGFTVFVYRGNVCLPNNDSIKTTDKLPNVPLADSIANNTNRISDCASRKITINSDVFPHDLDIYQYVGKNYTFVVIPFMSRNEALPEHIIGQFNEAVKTFSVLPQEPLKNDNIRVFPKNVIVSQAAKIQKAAPAPVRTRGTMVCPDPQQKPAYSKTKGRHMDEDCCPDPDEWPNPQCAYPAAAFKILMSGPKKK